MAPACTSSAALVTDATSNRSEKSTKPDPPGLGHGRAQLRQLFERVQPGLSVITSLPCRMASIASAARSAGMAAISTRSTLGSSSSARRSANRRASGNRFWEARQRLGLALGPVTDQLGTHAEHGAHLSVNGGGSRPIAATRSLSVATGRLSGLQSGDARSRSRSRSRFRSTARPAPEEAISASISRCTRSASRPVTRGARPCCNASAKSSITDWCQAGEGHGSRRRRQCSRPRPRSPDGHRASPARACAPSRATPLSPWTMINSAPPGY